MLVIFFVSSLAETQRPPSTFWRRNRIGGGLLGIFLRAFPAFLPGEYTMRDALRSYDILFLGGWLSPINIWPLNIPALGIIRFLLKLAFLFFMMAMVKAMVPRSHYPADAAGLENLLPTSLLWWFCEGRLGLCFSGTHL